MALPVTVYRWDDAGAPQLTTEGKPSQFFEILKKCLVEGYGNKQPLGWTAPYEDLANLKIAFRNSTADGSGGYVRFSAANDNNNSNVEYQSALTMTGLQDSEMYRTGYKCLLNSDSDRNQWVLIGTSTGFYFMVTSSILATAVYVYQQYHGVDNCFFCGDIESVVSNDLGKFVATNPDTSDTGDQSSTQYTQGFHYMNYYGVFGKIYESSGGNESKDHSYFTLWSVANINPVKESSQGHAIYSKLPIVVSGYTQNQTGLNDSEGTPIRDSLLMPPYRGFIPGVLQASNSNHPDDDWPVVKTINGKQHWLLKNTGNIAPQFWIDMESWDA